MQAQCLNKKPVHRQPPTVKNLNSYVLSQLASAELLLSCVPGEMLLQTPKSWLTTSPRLLIGTLVFSGSVSYLLSNMVVQRGDDLGLFSSDLVDHEPHYILKYSTVKYEAICLTANALFKWSQGSDPRHSCWGLQWPRPQPDWKAVAQLENTMNKQMVANPSEIKQHCKEEWGKLPPQGCKSDCFKLLLLKMVLQATKLWGLFRLSPLYSPSSPLTPLSLKWAPSTI